MRDREKYALIAAGGVLALFVVGYVLVLYVTWAMQARTAGWVSALLLGAAIAGAGVWWEGGKVE